LDAVPLLRKARDDVPYKFAFDNHSLDVRNMLGNDLLNEWIYLATYVRQYDIIQKSEDFGVPLYGWGRVRDSHIEPFRRLSPNLSFPLYAYLTSGCNN
jgi:hypothetical protein